MFIENVAKLISLPGIQAWLGFVAIGVWVMYTLHLQYKAWIAHAKRLHEKVMMSCTASVAVLGISWYLWTVHRLPLITLGWQTISGMRVVYKSILSILSDRLVASVSHWIILVWLVSISVRLWNNNKKDLAKMVSEPGCSSSITSVTTEDQKTTVVVNVTAMDRVEEMLRKLVHLIPHRDLNAIPIPMDEAQSSKDSLKTAERVITSNNAYITRDEFFLLEAKLDHLTMLFLSENEKFAPDKTEDVNGETSGASKDTEVHSEEKDEVRAVYAVQAIKTSKKRRHGRGQTGEEQPAKNTSGLTAEELSEFAGKNYDEIIAELQRRKTQKPAENKLPEYLTDEEKAIGKSSLAALARQWRVNSGLELRAADYLEIGILNEELAEMPRKFTQEIIRVRRRGDLIKRLTEEGKKVSVCPTCEKVVTSNQPHTCWKTNWTVGTRKKCSPAETTMVLSQTGRGNIQIKQHTEVDSKKVNTELQKMRQLQIMADERLRASIPQLKTPISIGLTEEAKPVAKEATDPEDVVIVVDAVLAPTVANAIMRKNLPVSGTHLPAG